MEQMTLTLDPRSVFKGYAWIAFIGGLLLIVWGPAWLGTDLGGIRYLQADLIRITGSVLIAAACCALQFARVEEPKACRDGLLWFGGAHLAVMMVLMAQRSEILVSDASALISQLVFPGVFFLFAWATTVNSNPPIPLTTLFSPSQKESTEVLRSRYEQEIRAAAGQEERNRLARELHDSIKQQMFVIQTAAATAQARFDSDAKGAREAVEQIRSSARAAITELEVMLSQLRAEPLGDKGLVEAIRHECEALGFRTGAKVDFQVGELPSKGLAPGAHNAILRVLQESLANIGRHARPSRVTVSLATVPGTFLLTVEDDGQGFDTNVTSTGMGLRNMRERAQEFHGQIEITSRPGEGSKVLLSLPLTDAGEARSYLRNAVLWAAAAVVFVSIMVIRGKSGMTAAALISTMYSLKNFTAYGRARQVLS